MLFLKDEGLLIFVEVKEDEKAKKRLILLNLPLSRLLLPFIHIFTS